MRLAILKITAAALALLLTCACGINEAVEEIQGNIFEKTKFDDDTNYTAIEHGNIVENASYESNGEVRFGYDSLCTDSQRACYDMIGQSAYKIAEEKGEDGFYAVGKVTVADKTFTDKDMDICIKAYTMDHPEVFWLTNRYTYGTAGNQAVIQLYSYVSGEDCSRLMNEIDAAANSLISGIPGGLKEYHLEKYIHNALLDRCTYAEGVKTAEDGWEEFTVYGALVKGSAVCEGYAHTMCLLLNRVGIDCYYANGYGENSPHMWNTVKLGENWYHLDATWDDNEKAYFNYFNLNDEQISTDHIIQPRLEELESKDSLPEVYNLFLPQCTSDSANYFVIESTYVGDFEESRGVMVTDLINSAQNGDEMFTIRIDPGLDYNDTIDEMFNREPYYVFECITEANESLDSEHQINNENLAIIMIENFHAVVVKLEY